MRTQPAKPGESLFSKLLPPQTRVGVCREELVRAFGGGPREPGIRERPVELPEVDAIAPRIGARLGSDLECRARDCVAHDLGELLDPVILEVAADVERLVVDG